MKALLRRVVQCLSILLLGLASQFVWASLLSFEEVYLRALEHDAAYARDRLALPLAQSQQKEVAGALGPHLMGRAHHSRVDIRTNVWDPQVIHPYGYSLELSQPLVHLPAWFAYVSARDRTTIAQLADCEAKQAWLLDLAERYYEWGLSKKREVWAKELARVFERELQETLKKFKYGLVTGADRDEARAFATQALADAYEAQRRYADAEEALREKIGVLTEEDALFSDRMPPEPFNETPSVWVSRVVQKHGVMQQYRILTHIAANDWARARTGALPTLSMIGHYEDRRQEAFGASALNRKSATIGVAMSLSLLEGGALQARMEQSRILLEKARAEERVFEQELRRKAMSLLKALHMVQFKLKARQSALQAASQRLRSVRMGYSVGLRTESDVLNAQKDLFAARVAQLEVEKEQVLLSFQKMQYEGTLDEDHLWRHRSKDVDSRNLTPNL